MATAQLNGISLYYDEHGEGAPLLLVAGLSSDSQSWLPVIEPLAAHYRLILPDNRMVGRTEPKTVETGIDIMADDVVALMDELGVDKAHIVGHSMGGAVSLDLAARYPERVEKLVILCSGPIRTARNISLVDTLVRQREEGVSDDTWFRSFFYWLFSPGFFEDEAAVGSAVEMAKTYPWRQPIEAMRKQQRAIAAYQAGDVIARIKAPTLGVAGGNDLMIPPDDMRAVLSGIADFRFEVIDNAAHSIHWEAPEAVVERILAFLGE